LILAPLQEIKNNTRLDAATKQLTALIQKKYIQTVEIDK
jgi:hypothetical protein